MSENKFRIGYFADGPWAHEAFELLINDPTLEIMFIVPRSDTKDQTLKNYASEFGIDYLHPVKINSEDFLAKAETYSCDLFISMSFNQIFRKPVTHLPKFDTINCHAGKLPFYRGRNILNWALINDEDEFGITVHFVDEGIDTGDIILQRSFPITDDDDYSTLLEVAHKECANILYEAVKQIQSGINQRIDQKNLHPVGFYCGRRGEGDEIIDWNQTSREIFNFIRSVCQPGPMALSFKNGKPVKINKSRLISQAPVYKNTPGQLLSKTKDGFLVKTKDSFIEILEIHTDGKLIVGDKLGK